MVSIWLNIYVKQKDIEAFLSELHTLLNDKSFDEDKQFVLIRSRKSDIKHSTPYTLADLEYDTSDVVARLRELTVGEFSEVKVDTDDTNPPYLYVFGKQIESRLVYIKIKTRENADSGDTVICVSFHYPEDAMEFPFSEDKNPAKEGKNDAK